MDVDLTGHDPVGGEPSSVLRAFDHDGIRFVYETEGAGQPIVLLHGLGGNRAAALELCSPGRGRLRVALDQRGHGDTEPVDEPSGFTFDAFAGDVVALLDTMGADRAVLAGVSMGAAVALTFALRNPSRVSALALVRPAWTHVPMTRNLEPNVQIARLLQSLPADRALAAFQGSEQFARLRAESGHAARSLSGQVTLPRAAERAIRLDLLPRSTPYSDPAELRSISAPTLVVGCDRDPLHPVEFAETWSRLIPNASLVMVASPADDVEAHRSAVRAVVDRFISESAGRSTGNRPL